MKFIRKALLPAVVAAGFLGFLGAVGPTASTVSAATGDVCSVTGPTSIPIGVATDYTAIVDNEPDGTISVDLNDQVGDTDITSKNDVTIPNTDSLDDVLLTSGPNVCGTTDDALYKAAYDANYAKIKQFLTDAIDRGENCAGPAGIQPTFCDLNAFPPDNHANDTTNGVLLSWQDNDIDCGLTAINGGTCEIPGYVLELAAKSLATDYTKGFTSCATIAGKMEDAILQGWQGGTLGTSNYIAAQFEDFILNYSNCVIPGTAAVASGLDGYITVDVTCDVPGVFDLSFSTDGSAKSTEVVCGDDVVTADIFAVPTSVEINPSIANVAHSLVWVSLKGRDGQASAPGTKVTFLTDRCSIETGTVDSEAEFDGLAGPGTAATGAETVFKSVNPLVPATAQALESSVYTTGVDGASRQQDETVSYSVTGSAGSDYAERTIAAAVLNCDPVDAPSVTPGPATVTVIIDRGSINNGLVADNDDLVIKTTVTVVGPPAANGVTVTAAPSTLACGEKATITVDVKDSIGQPVSDHTFVEAVTNAGGVLAGTGAVAGQAGLVAPVSSTVAETFGGKVTFYLLTSTANVGKYEVVITTGGGGGVTGQLVNGGTTTNLLGGLFTTAPISVQVTVECTVPVVAAPASPAPTTSGPATGQGIKPPSTGDAGLASTESNTWVFGAVVAVVAALAIAGFSVKLVREE